MTSINDEETFEIKNGELVSKNSSFSSSSLESFNSRSSQSTQSSDKKVYQLTEEEIKKLICSATQSSQNKEVKNESKNENKKEAIKSTQERQSTTPKGFSVKMTKMRSGYQGSGKAIRNVIDPNFD